MVRNSPEATSREIPQSTARFANRFSTFLIESSGSADGRSTRADDRTAFKKDLRKQKDRDRRRSFCRNSTSLRRLHFIPNLVVFVAAGILLPKVNVLHVLVH